MILVSGGIKGGSGKTTLATNLTVMRAMVDKKVMLIDADEQYSASDWADQREELKPNDLATFSTIRMGGRNLHAQLDRLISDHDDIIIDVGGRDTTSQRSALVKADVFIVPFKPRSLDVWTIPILKSMISEVKAGNPKLKVIAVINQADSKGEDNQAALEIIASIPEIVCCPTFIGNRKCFGNASGEGLSIVEMKKKDQKSVQEMIDVYKFIYTGNMREISKESIKDSLSI